MSKTLLGISLFFIFSCTAMNKSFVNDNRIPSEISGSTYKTLFCELDFNGTVSKNVSKVHNNSAEKYLKNKFKGASEFINAAELSSEKYSDKTIYRFVLVNKISKKVTTKIANEPTIEKHVSGFYFIDREKEKIYPYVGQSTTALSMFKAIITKMNKYF